ncbi:hypothetical protein BDR03DRAFT_929799 [Suillus americanus]|nr:hypothetical protein BDR03DRAFT_929799 [Suillus americanus]
MEDHDADQKRRREINPSYPFVDQAEWQLAEFLAQRLTQTNINKFLKLDWFKTRARPSFKSADQLFGWIDSLPGGPEWQSTTLEFLNYTTAWPIELIWRDGPEVVKDLFANPIFANHMMYDPHCIMVGAEREYGEFFTGERAFFIQVQLFNQLPEGATMVPIMLASDKTPVTWISGGLEMHPIFLTIGNIQSKVRMKATAHTWHCIRFIPIPKFDVHPDFQMLLHACLFHKCMDVIFAKCKVATKTSEYMPDPTGYLMLSGVHQPFWGDWIYADPRYFLIGDMLHTGYKFFGDHPLKWCKEVVGEEELDACYKAHHKCVSTRHFGSGISHINQMTCREHRDIERTMVAKIAGATNTTPKFIQSIRMLTEFIYQAQSPVHTNSSIHAMVQLLSKFHRLKQAILDAGTRRGKSRTIENFLIPKLELFHSFAGSVKDSSGLIQYSSNISERLLITHCKFPFKRTSRQAKSFTLQVVQILNREEIMHRFNLYTLLQMHGTPHSNAITTEDNIIAETDPTLAWIAHILPDQQHHFHGPRPVRNHFLKGILTAEAKAAFHVTVTPDQRSLTLCDLPYTYSLPDFAAVLTEYINKMSQHGPTMSWTHQTDSIWTWNKFHIQLVSTFQSRVVMPSQVVQAYLPSEAFPLGNCNTVLVQSSENDNIYIAQVHCIFQPIAKTGHTLPHYLEATPLLYIQYFQITSTPDEEPSVGMYRVRQIIHQDGMGQLFRPGAIIALTDVTCAIELIPVFGLKLDRTMTATNSMEVCNEYFLNIFSDKEVFHMMHTDIM